MDPEGLGPALIAVVASMVASMPVIWAAVGVGRGARALRSAKALLDLAQVTPDPGQKERLLAVAGSEIERALRHRANRTDRLLFTAAAALVVPAMMLIPATVSWLYRATEGGQPPTLESAPGYVLACHALVVMGWIPTLAFQYRRRTAPQAPVLRMVRGEAAEQTGPG